MTGEIGLIGFGEAAQAFARAGWRAFDVADRRSDFARCGVTGCATNADAVAGAGAILSLVTADQALAAARATAETIGGGALFVDMNSVAPDTKRAAAACIEAAGGCYVDAAIMAPAHPARRGVPVLTAGPHADAGAVALAALGFTDVRAVGGEVGRAAAIKLIRSVMIKGVEALTAEMMAAACAAGVTDEVLASLEPTWRSKAAYNLERMTVHGARRAAEMAEAARTLESLGIEPVMTRGTVQRQREMATVGRLAA